jgi:hypothetical protein
MIDMARVSGASADILVVTFGLTLLALGGLRTRTASMQNPFQPVPVDSALAVDKAPLLGSTLPFEVPARQQGKALVVAVHSDCSSCSMFSDSNTEACFGDSSVFNVVVAADARPYRSAARRLKATVLFAGREAVASLGTPFSPRLYVYDRSGKLVYFQSAPAANLQLELKKCREILEGPSD